MEKEIIKCCKCFITLKRLKEDKITELLLKVVNEDGEEKYLCPICFEGW